MAKSGIGEIYIWQAVDNLVCQHTDRRKNDFAISITFGDYQVMAPSAASRSLVSSCMNNGFRAYPCYSPGLLVLRLS